MSERPNTEEFVRELTGNARRIYGYILALLPNWADADDVFQETSAILWEKFGEYEPGTNFRAWAFRIAYNKVLQHRRAHQKSLVSFSEEFIKAVDQESLSIDDNFDARHQALAHCYQALKQRDRDLIDHRYRPGATTKSVSKIVGRSVDALYKAMNRIHLQLIECVNRAIAREELP